MTTQGLGACTPAADVRRLLEYAPDKLCVVRVQDGSWRLLVEQEGGRWASDEGVVGQQHIEVALDWQRRITKAAAAGTLSAQSALACTRHAVASARPAGRREMLGMVGPTYLYMKTHGLISPDSPLSFCEEAALDTDRLSMGAPNGVIDLTTGVLLSAAEARKRYVTRAVPDPYDPDAKHPYADDLVAHLTPEEQDYLLRATSYATRGNPARQTYALTGDRGGGKSTYQSSVYAALGDVKRGGYAMRPRAEAFQKSRWGGGASEHQGNLAGIEYARVVMVGEPKDNRPIDMQLVKDLSGGDPQIFRDVKEKAPPAVSPMCTLFFALNRPQLGVLNTSEGGWHLLEYPSSAGDGR